MVELTSLQPVPAIRWRSGPNAGEVARKTWHDSAEAAAPEAARPEQQQRSAPPSTTVTISSAATVRFMPDALQAVGQRRLQIGERDAGYERQEDFAEEPDQARNHQEQEQPEREVTAVIIGRPSPPWAVAASSSGFGSFMCRTHSAR